VQGTLWLPKFGPVRLRHSRLAVGELKNVTLRLDGRRWVASLQTEREVDVQMLGNACAAADSVGLEFGAAPTLMPSLGAPIELPARIGRYERCMKRLQRTVSRKRRARPTARRPWPGWAPFTRASRRCAATSCTSAPRNWCAATPALPSRTWR
jgi:hypothetical protein